MAIAETVLQGSSGQFSKQLLVLYHLLGVLFPVFEYGAVKRLSFNLIFICRKKKQNGDKLAFM